MTTIQEMIQNWVNVDPKRPSFSALSVTDGSASARGNFLGEDNSDPAAAGESIYTETQNLPTAIASILNHSQSRADFHPAITPPEELARVFGKYVTEIDKNPFFHLLTNESNKEVFNSSDYNLLIDQVINMYKGVSENDLNAIKTSISDMAKSVFGQKSAEQWKNLFSQSTLDLSNLENPRFYLYYTTLHMYHNQDGKSEVKQESYEVQRTEYVILPDLIRANAPTLASLDKKSVDDWLSESASPEQPNVKLCFTVRPFRQLVTA